MGSTISKRLQQQDNIMRIRNVQRQREMDEREMRNHNNRLHRRTPQRDVVYMPQPPTGAMATKMNMKINNDRLSMVSDEIEANIKNIRKDPQLQRTPKLITSRGMSISSSSGAPNNLSVLAPNNISAATPSTGTIQE